MGNTAGGEPVRVRLEWTTGMELMRTAMLEEEEEEETREEETREERERPLRSRLT